MSDDDKLLRRLGAVAADVDEANGPLSSKWERLLRGELSADEVTELERAAETDEETAMLLSAYRPLDAGVREHIAADLVAHRAAPRGIARVEATASVTAPSRWGARAAAITATLALAAGVAFYVTRAPAPEPLAVYALDVSGSSTSRGPAATEHQPLKPGGCVIDASTRGSFELLARTEGPSAGNVAAYAFLIRAEDEPQHWPGALEVSASGSVRILESVELLRDARELRIVITRAHVSAEDAREKARRAPTSGPGWQVLGCAITR